MINSRVFFVYHAWIDDRLVKSNLTESEANEVFDQTNSLIESGCCGDGCAVIGRLDDPSDYYVCQRLGLKSLCYV